MIPELKLYRLLCTKENDCEDYLCDEIGWINEEQFCVWIPYHYLEYVIEKLSKIFGRIIFDDGGFNAKMQEGCACIDLCEAIGGCIDIETVFPKDEFKH